ncbi:hypothetical protein EVB91_103 [Rhizobium phage RHph_I1_18]|nr:hypothetical protein EVB91_103 [Rhizobium phage RHph_I1_18]
MIEFDRYDNLGKQFKKVADIEDKQERRDALRFLCVNNHSAALIVQYCFHPDVEWDFPGPIPASEWTPSKVPNHKGLVREARKLRHLFKSSPVKKMQKQVIYKGILEILEPEDVELLLSIVEKRTLPSKTLNKLFTMAAIPELFPPVESNK